MELKVDELTKLASEGSTEPLTTSPVVGSPSKKYADVFKPGESIDADEVRVTILGSGDPFVKKAQAAASVLIEVGNEEKDFFFFDLGSGALANFNSLGLPITSTTKLFLTHLHADHIGDVPTLLGSFAKSGRRDPVEVWGPAGDTKELGTIAFAEHMEKAALWDIHSLSGHPDQSGAKLIAKEVPYDKPTTVYEKNGVKISSFPVIHVQNGAVGYRLEYQGNTVVYSGDTRPCQNVIDACEGADLLIHETFPSVKIFAKKAGIPESQAAFIVNNFHTSPTMAGKVFKKAGAKMSVMWHLGIDHETVGSVFEEMQNVYDGPATIAQDLTVFNITKDAVVTRQAVVNPISWPNIGKTIITGPPMSQPLAPPKWWAEKLITE